MSEAISKYLHQEMDRQAGIEHTFHRTKIVATIGPSCDTYEKMLELARAGVNVFRLNFSHGKNEDKARILGLIDRMNKKNPLMSHRLQTCKAQS
jgi:pyruvate kinase